MTAPGAGHVHLGWFARGGTHRRFTIDTPEYFWVVERGELDVFAVDAHEGQPSGRLRAVLHLTAGEAVFGIHPEALAGVTLLASPGPDMTLTRYPLRRFCEQALISPPHAAMLVGLLDGWIDSLSRAAVTKAVPRNPATLDTGQTVTIGESARAVTPGRGVVWVQHARGGSRFCGLPALPIAGDAPWYALSKYAWIESDADADLHGHDTLTCLRVDPDLTGLARFHRDAVACLTQKLAALDATEQGRLQNKSQADLRTLTFALQELSSPLIDDETPGAPADGVDTPLMRVCHAIGEAMGVTMKPHPDLLRGLPLQDAVANIARASGIRVRRVALHGRWWTQDGGPLLVFRESDQRRMALLPNARSGYRLYDPVAQTTTRVTEAIAMDLSPFGYCFYRPFPMKVLTLMDLLVFGCRGSRAEIITVLAMGVATGLLAIATPVATGIVFDSLVPGSRRGDLLVLCGALIISAIAAGLFNLSRGFAVLRLQGRMGTALQAAIWDRLLDLPAPFFRQYAAGDLAARSIGIAQMRQILTGATLTSILSGIFGIFSFALLFVYSSRLALVATVLTLVVVGISVSAGYVQLRLQRDSYTQLGTLSGMVLEFITAISKFRVAGTEGRAFALWVRQFVQQKRTDLAARRVAMLLAVVNAVYLPGALAVIFVYHSSLLQQGGAALTTGGFLAFIAAFTQFMSSSLALTSAAIGALAIVPLYERAMPILQTLPEVDPAKGSPGELSGRVECSHLVFRYAPDAPLVLRDVSVSIAPGEYVAFVGPSGCGKSTLFRLLLGFERPEAGAIYYDGKDLGSVDLQLLRRQIGVVLQAGTLLSGNILDNIRGASSASVEDAWEAAALAGLDEDIRKMAMGMYTMISEGGGGFSGGQRQRILIARAIVRKPRLLLFDEATSALDNRTQAIVSRSLKSLKATRIVIAHRLSTIMEADRIYVMDKGRVVEAGTYHELLKQQGWFYKLASRQIA